MSDSLYEEARDIDQEQFDGPVTEDAGCDVGQVDWGFEPPRKKSALRVALRILVGALIGLGLAVAEVIVLIVITEWAISKGWLDVYDDATIAVIVFCSLIAAPIIGGWKAWIGGRDETPTHS